LENYRSRHHGAAVKKNEMQEMQRLGLVEKNVKLDRMLLLFLAGLIILTIIVTVSISLVSSIYTSEGERASAAIIAELQEEITELRNDLQRTQLQLQVSGNETSELKALFENSNAPALQKMMLAQEQGFQDFIRSMKDGIYDLARIVPGSRTWLQVYSDKMDTTLQLSLKRQQALRKLTVDNQAIRP